MERADMTWRVSSYSSNGGATCVEAGSLSGAVLVRDTTDRDGGALVFSAQAWKSFASRIKHSEAV